MRKRRKSFWRRGAKIAAIDPKIDLNFFATNAIKKHGKSVKGLIALSRGAGFTGVAEVNEKIKKSVDEMWAPVEDLQEVNLNWLLEKEELRLVYSQAIDPTSKGVKFFADAFEGRKAGSHLLGILPDRSFAVLGMNFDPKLLVDAEKDKSAVVLASASTPGISGKIKKAGKLIRELATQMTGAIVVAFSAPKKEELSMAWVYQLNPGANARSFWAKRLPWVNSFLKEEYKAVLKKSEVRVGGLRFDHYLCEDAGEDENWLGKIQIDVGQLGDLALVLVSTQGSKLALEQLSISVQGKRRVAELPRFERMGAFFAGNPIAFAVDVVQLSKLDISQASTAGKSEALGQLYGAVAGNRAGGLAIDVRLDRKSVSDVAAKLKDIEPLVDRLPGLFYLAMLLGV